MKGVCTILRNQQIAAGVESKDLISDMPEYKPLEGVGEVKIHYAPSPQEAIGMSAGGIPFFNKYFLSEEKFIRGALDVWKAQFPGEEPLRIISYGRSIWIIKKLASPPISTEPDKENESENEKIGSELPIDNSE